MNYEKKYEDALERASKLRVQNPFDTVSQMMEHVFPDLKESEDERIRKALINGFKDYKGWDEEWFDGITVRKAIAWLEKQGEQKPTDKVEPKFKIDDWIIDNNIKTPFQITGISNEKYDVISIYGNDMAFSFREVEHFYHLWTIQDAKDGDMLCTYECGKPKIVFILKGTPKKHYALSYHCYYNIMYPHFASDSEKGCLAPNDEDVKPATKEQRDILFQKMHEASYEWDSEKKELRKIENRPLLSDFFNAEYERGKADVQKSTEWSENDSVRLQRIIDFLWYNRKGDTDTIYQQEQDIDWLKSLKQRIGG